MKKRHSQKSPPKNNSTLHRGVKCLFFESSGKYFFHQHTNISFNNKNMVALSWNKWVETVDKQKFCHLHQNATTMLGSGFCLKNLAKFLKKKKDMKMTEEEKLLNYTSWSNPSMYCPPSLEYPSSSSHWIPSINFEAANHELLFPDKGRDEQMWTEGAIKTVGIAWQFKKERPDIPNTWTHQLLKLFNLIRREEFQASRDEIAERRESLHSGRLVDGADGQFNWDVMQMKLM